MKLRPYQLDAIDQIRDAIRAGKRRILLQLPTGGGKTLTAASMLASGLDKGSRSLFAAHRVELIDQTVGTFARLGITSLGVIRSGDKRADLKQPIQIASIQTLARRAKPSADVVFIDEAHRAAAPSYEALIEEYAGAVIVGLTATPCRADGKPLKMFEVMVHGASYSQLIAEGHIVAPLVYSTPVLPDLTTCRTVAGDYSAEDLEDAVNKSSLIGNIGSEWTKRADGRRTVVFAVSVAHSLAIVEMFRGLGVAAEHVDGTTPETERRSILARLASGTTTVVSNVGVLCEGWDLPACKCLVLARPTKSLSLFMQMSGRILRPHDGTLPIILDHGGNVDRHGMPHEDREWSLEDKPKRSGAAPSKACKECFAMIAASLMTCPHCGYEFPVPVHEPEPEPVDPRLAHVELALRSITGDDVELVAFRDMSRRAREKSWKPGAVYFRFVERFGHEPPAEWTRALKRGFKKDADWRTAIDERVGAFEEVGT